MKGRMECREAFKMEEIGICTEMNNGVIWLDL